MNEPLPPTPPRAASAPTPAGRAVEAALEASGAWGTADGDRVTFVILGASDSAAADTFATHLREHGYRAAENQPAVGGTRVFTVTPLGTGGGR